jgi:hypothetical protein
MRRCIARQDASISPMLVDERPSISRARLARASDAKCSRERSAAWRLPERIAECVGVAPCGFQARSARQRAPIASSPSSSAKKPAPPARLSVSIAEHASAEEVASVVLPMPGRPAMMTNSPGR